MINQLPNRMARLWRRLPIRRHRRSRATPEALRLLEKYPFLRHELQKKVIEEHGAGLERTLTDEIMLMQENGIDIESLLPFEIEFGTDGSGGLKAKVKDRKAQRFLKERGVIAIERNGVALRQPTEGEVLRIIYDAKTGKDVYGSDSPHRVLSRAKT